MGHEMAQFYLHFGSDFSPHPDVEYEARIARGQAPEFGRWQVLFPEKPLN
jgi:hypothetical protein